MAEKDDWYTPPQAPSGGGAGADDWITPKGSEPTWGETAVDVGKQALAAIPLAAEERAAAIPSLMGAAGRGFEYLFGPRDPNAPWYLRAFQSDPEAVAQREQLGKLIAQQRGRGIADYLPDPVTESGRAARNIATTALGGAGTGVGGPTATAVGGIIRDVISPASVRAALGSEAAGQVAERVAPDYAAAARAGGAFLGGLTGIRKGDLAAQEAALEAAPSDIKAGAKALYGPLDEAASTSIEPMARSQFGELMRQQLRNAGVRDFGSGETAYKAVQNFISDTRDLGDVMSWRRAMRDQLFRKGEGRAAHALTDVADQAVDHMFPDGGSILKAADREWSHKALVETLNDQFGKLESQTSAAHSGANLDNKIRQALTSLQGNERAWAGLTPQEQVRVQSIIKGTIPTNVLRGISNVLGGGGGLGHVGAMLLGHAVMGPVGLAVGTVGPPLKALENAIAAQRSLNLRTAIAARSLPGLQSPSFAAQIARTTPFVTSAADALPPTP